jgi:hypothetical protein
MGGLSVRGLAEKDAVQISMADLDLAGALNEFQLEALKPIIQAEAKLLGDTDVIFTEQAKGKYESGGYPVRMSFPVDDSTGEIDPTKYTKMNMYKVPFSCVPFRSVQKLPDREVRNSLQRGNFGAYAMQQSAPRLALDIEEYGLLSSTAYDSSDATYGDFSYFDGLVVQAQDSALTGITTSDTNVTSLAKNLTAVELSPGTAQDFDDECMFNMRAAMSDQKFWRDPANMRYYVSPMQEAVLQYKRISQHGTRGYEYAEQDKRYSMTYQGVPIFALPGLPNTMAILTHRMNIVFFLEQAITWELWRYGIGKTWYYIVDYSLDARFIWPGGVVIHSNLATPSIETT